MDRMPEEERLAGYHLLFRPLKVTEKTNISYLQKLQWRTVFAQNGYFENAVLCVPMDNLCQTLTVPLKLPWSREIPWNIFVLTLYKLKNQIQKKKKKDFTTEEKNIIKKLFLESVCALVNLHAVYIISPVGGDKSIHSLSVTQWTNHSTDLFKNHFWVLLRDAQASVHLGVDSFETIFIDGAKIDQVTVNIVSKR